VVLHDLRRWLCRSGGTRRHLALANTGAISFGSFEERAYKPNEKTHPNEWRMSPNEKRIRMNAESIRMKNESGWRSRTPASSMADLGQQRGHRAIDDQAAQGDFAYHEGHGTHPSAG
jgi:hypothetical protein